MIYRTSHFQSTLRIFPRGTVQPLAESEDYDAEEVPDHPVPSPRRHKRAYEEDEEVALFRRVRIKTSIITTIDSRPPVNYQLGGQHYQRHNFPPLGPADQNPPCNTLYVGNLPIDASEDELKAMFSKQPGYKRLCFRTKQNGPMCFIEFEDVSFATKAMLELYGRPLHNSVKGGIRISYSKNPLGVRSTSIASTNGESDKETS